MKIVSRQELFTMPAGTLFTEVDSDGRWDNPLAIFGGKFADNDFLVRYIDQPEAHDSIETWDRADDMRDNGASWPVNTAYGRDGLFENDARYLVYEPADIASIIAHIAPAMRVLRSEDD